MLPQFNTQDRILSMLQSQWKSELDPVLSNPLVNGRLITNVSLSVGNNTINHRLSRKLVGWIVVGQSAASSIYDGQATNPMPDATLILNSSATCTVALWVF